MKLISHPNVVDLKYYFFSPGEKYVPLFYLMLTYLGTE